MNLNGKIKKMQTAIIKSGLILKINTSQFYSNEQKRMITSYRLSIPVLSFSERKEEWKICDYEILKTCSMSDVLFCLVDIYKAVKEWGS